MSILVVEDDVLIRMILVEELLEAGFRVSQAESGDEAASMLDGLDPPLRLLVTDIHMPGDLNGIDLAREVTSRWTHVPVIYTTGRPDALARLGPKQSLIRKPYVPATVIACVQHHLAS